MDVVAIDFGWPWWVWAVALGVAVIVVLATISLIKKFG
ncbi:putative membrane-anchored protein [Alkalihalobacillus xiaoxiensis]|uniref:Membrane-anchored protein n=1 Tax=Shouchella xiaoxiensis TaxID=766895 RepID=A0ABS2SW26_9BACI|nr:putative membrane-anchored protein [Shouchella xiaoxiensis]